MRAEIIDDDEYHAIEDIVEGLADAKVKLSIVAMTCYLRIIDEETVIIKRLLISYYHYYSWCCCCITEEPCCLLLLLMLCGRMFSRGQVVNREFEDRHV